jgi:hypothetical protein
MVVAATRTILLLFTPLLAAVVLEPSTIIDSPSLGRHVTIDDSPWTETDCSHGTSHDSPLVGEDSDYSHCDDYYYFHDCGFALAYAFLSTAA